MYTFGFADLLQHRDEVVHRIWKRAHPVAITR
jgi:hypothetical protein